MFCLFTTEECAELALGENAANLEKTLVEKEGNFNILARFLEV